MSAATGTRAAPSWLAELAREACTVRFWLVVVRNALPAAGVVVLGWPALHAALMFVLESWLYLSLRAGIESTMDPRSGGGSPPTARRFAVRIATAAAVMALVIGGVAWFVLGRAFPRADWAAFLVGGWRDHWFLAAVAALLVLSIADAVFARIGFASRSEQQRAADKARARVLLLRVVLLLLFSWLLALAAAAGRGPQAVVVTIGLVSIFLEGLPETVRRLFAQSGIRAPSR